MARKKVSFIIGNTPDFDVPALKYFILSMNKIQGLYEFNFPDTSGFIFADSDTNGDAMIDKVVQEHSDTLSKADYCIVVITSYLEGNYFSVSSGNVSIITTHGWQKHFSPPSLFEYLLNSSIACLLCMNNKLSLSFHIDTYGCALDYTRVKMDDRVDIAMGYICDVDKKHIVDSLGKKYLAGIESILNRSWIGSISQLHSVAYNLKHYFKFDIEKDSGLNKSSYEKIKDGLYDIPGKTILLIVGAVISILLLIIGVKK